MPGIFLSWGLPDQERVLPFSKRLRTLGLDVWEYSESKKPGKPIYEQVLGAINKSQIAIICFSDQTANRPWITTELAWSYQAVYESTSPCRHLIPVWIGSHPKNKKPKTVEDNSLDVTDLSNASEADLIAFVRKLTDLLGQDAPLVVPAAIFAINKQQCRELFKKHPQDGPLVQACRAVGMAQPPDLFKSLLDRYGKGAEDFSPFRPGQRFRDSINEWLLRVNAWRAAANPPQRPIFLRWMRDEPLSRKAPEYEESRNLWRSAHSLMVVDSVSTFHEDVQKRLAEWPHPSDVSRRVLLWIPPYTCHLTTLDDSLRNAAQVVPHMGDAFNDWQQHPTQPIAFDTSTLVGVEQWLQRALLGVPDQPGPVDRNIEEMQAPGTPRVSIGGMMKLMPQPGATRR